jgi:hypothetical protein
LNKNYEEVFNKLKQDIIYLDPPWGGKDYKYKKSVDLNIGNLSLKNIVNKIINKKLSRYIFIKVPFNCNINGIKIDDVVVIYNKYHIKSFLILCIKC